ncbi:Gfo/Idh/MocA family oxidoreductase [Gammaproteobacteria bacterium]|nr:Gfo/Idh/MocA family oxidoreductase [Gammaproteobacteria bacterium]
MIGGGPNAFIGEVHRLAARMDNRFELVAGCFSADYLKSIKFGIGLGLDSERIYRTPSEMASAEAEKENGIEVAIIVTPNNLHFDQAKTMIQAGFHVICDKPITSDLKQAEELERLVDSGGTRFMVTYNYSGYPMVREAREIISSGRLGKLRVVQVEYPQDWLATDIEASGQKQAAWRTDPSQAGEGGAIGDIGTHAYHLAEFVTGEKPHSLLADLDSFVLGRVLDDNAHILLRYESGLKGMLWVSQIACGHENGLQLRVYGDQGSLEWHQEAPNFLEFKPLGGPTNTLSRGGPGLGTFANESIRIPAGHPEGFIEGFANLYRDFADHLRQSSSKSSQVEKDALPKVADGVNGVRFVKAAVASSKAGGVWRSLH